MHTVKGRDAGPCFTASKEARAVDVPGREIRPRPAPTIFVLDAPGAPRRHGSRCVATLSRLNAGLVIGRNNVVAEPQPAAIPAARVEIQDRVRARGEPRVAGKQPTSMAPRPD